MSVAEAAHRPAHKGRAAKLWLALVVILAAGIGLAWLGTEPLRGQTTASGLHFRTIEEGQGAFVQPVDGVLIEYEGRLEDGTVFDASSGRPVPMIAGEVIPGFAEALGMMQQGGSYRIKIPAPLAYGASPPPGSPVPPNADLIFDVKVVELVPNAALMMRQQGGQAEPPQEQPQR
jgi:FKBP-type peptidyl-prolyl cis-trans isomerase FkpA